MRRALWTLIAAGGCLAAGAGPEGVREDPPVASRPKAGDVRGRIGPAGRIGSLGAVCRATGKRYTPASFDAATGRFAFKALPGDATYDLTVVTKAGERIEGIDLSWHEARLLRLAAIRRRQLKLPPEPKHTFSRADANELIAYVRKLKDFANVRRALYVRGEGPRAAMLVEVMRTRAFYAQRGAEIIWRTELWYFRWRYGGWERQANVERVLERHRIPRDRWRGITLVYYPQLSAHVDEHGKSWAIEFDIPKALDPARGRIAGTEPAQKTKPVILGLPKRKTPKVPPTTAPAVSAPPRSGPARRAHLGAAQAPAPAASPGSSSSRSCSAGGSDSLT